MLRFVAFLLPFLPLAAQSDPGSLRRLIDLDELARPAPGVTMRQFASTDPSGRGHDHGHFVRGEGGHRVLAEAQGPGVLVRIWSANPAGRLLVFLDGETTPRIDAPFADLFAARYPPFCAPIATCRSGGCVSYFPIPFAGSCRVELAELERPQDLYYQIQCLQYPAGTPLRTFTRELPATEQAALAEVLRQWGDPAALAPQELAWQELQLGPGQYRDLCNTKGPDCVDAIAFVLDPRSLAPRALLLEASYDGAAQPSLAVPLLDLVAGGFGLVPFASLVAGHRADGLSWFRLPLPFRQRVRLVLRNLDPSATAVLRAGVRLRGAALPGAHHVLHGAFRLQDRVGESLYEWARIDGAGKLVGITQALQGVGDLWYLEGNERIVCDGAATPQIEGTGTEDFYNGGWYWNDGPFALPLHGLNLKAEWTTNRTLPFRWLVPDAVPCRDGLVATIEHGSRNQVRDACYSSVALWYGAARSVPRPRAEDLAIPRLWVHLPQGWTAASALDWTPAAAVSRAAWEQLSPRHRGLDRPLFQAFPVSYVQQDAAPVDPRVVLLPRGSDAPYRARIAAPHADRFRLELRFAGATHGGTAEISVDGVPWGKVDLTAADPGPLAVRSLGPLPLRDGAHELGILTTAGQGAVGFFALRLVPSSPYVRNWWVGPAVPCARGTSVADTQAEERAWLAPEFVPQDAGWKQVAAEGDHLDLGTHVAREAPMLAYVAVVVTAPVARVARVMLGSDDGARVWCNGALVWTHAVHRPLGPDQDAFDVPLRAGRNLLLVKIKNDDGGFGLMLRVADPH